MGRRVVGLVLVGIPFSLLSLFPSAAPPPSLPSCVWCSLCLAPRRGLLELDSSIIKFQPFCQNIEAELVKLLLLSEERIVHIFVSPKKSSGCSRQPSVAVAIKPANPKM